MDDERGADEPFEFRRYAVAALIGILLLLGLVLLVRPAIYWLAPERNDSNYLLGPVGEVGSIPVIEEVLLHDAHGLLGEERRGEHAAILVAASSQGGGLLSVVNAWSPVNDCPLAVGPDRFVDCAGAAWTFQGAPIESAHPALQAFPAAAVEGAVVVDFTAPSGGPAG